MHAVSPECPPRRVAGAARPAPRRALGRIALLAAGLLLLARHAPAQPGAMIADLRVEEEGVLVIDPAILALIETNRGEPLSIADVRLSEAHLMALNRLETVSVWDEPLDGGIRLTYRLVPAHPVDRIEFEGTLRLDADLLRRAVRERVGTAPFPAARAGEIVGLLRQVYEDHGYPGARIEAAEPILRHVPEHRATLVLRIDAGPRAVISQVVWDEGDEPPDPDVRRPDVRMGRPYDRQEIRRALDRWLERMRERRYYEALADDPLVEFGPGGTVVTLTLRRGPRVRVEFTGDPLTESEQERLVPVRTEASVDEDLLENWGFAIENYLRARGYRDAEVTHTSSPGAAEQTIVFDVRKGPRYVIGELRITGNEAELDETLREELGIEEGDPFVEAQLDAGAAVIAESYRTRGFTRVEVRPTAALTDPEQADAPTRRMQVVVDVVEGPRTFVRAIDVVGNTVLADAQLRSIMALGEGDPLSARALADSIAAIVLEYRNRGYETVAIEPPLIERVEGDDTRADVTIAIAEGPQVFVDRIIIEGNARTSRETIERELVLREGFPLGYTARFESQSRLSELGLFRRVRILDRPHVTDDRRDVLVQVEEALPTTIGYGGGLEISSRLRPTGDDRVAEERIELVPRSFFEIGRRNMWGKNRSVSLFTRISARSRDRLVAGELDTSYGVNEYRVYGTFSEPRLFGTFANILVTAIVERAIRTSYSFVTREVRAEMGGRLSAEYSGAVRFSVERTRLFDVDQNLDPEERPLIDRLFPQVRLSKFSGTLIRNTRDDDLDPSQGTFISADGEIAARAVGSEVGYVKGLVQGSWYRQLPSERRVVLAFRAIAGAARGFSLEDLPASERFFAGGSTSNRGFSTDRLGDEKTISSGGFPTGGNGEVLFNSEVRVGLFRALVGVAFFDAGNVFQRAADLSVIDLRPAAGFGIHYRSPVGPVRAEMGFNLDRRELAPGRLERGNVLHISLGPAF